MHRRRKVITGERVRFLLGTTAHCLGRELAIVGFESGLLGQGPFFVGLGPDAQQFGLSLMTHAPGNGVQDVALDVARGSVAEELPETVRSLPKASPHGHRSR